MSVPEANPNLKARQASQVRGSPWGILVLSIVPPLTLGPPALPLGLAMLAGYPLYRMTLAVKMPKRRDTAPIFLAALTWQLIHFTEELSFGFAQRFPELLGYPAWNTGLFIAFNLTYYCLFAAGLIGLQQRRAWLASAICAFATATLIGGPAHSALALWSGSYFPGLYTSWVGTGFSVFLIVNWRKTARKTSSARDGMTPSV